MCLEDEREKLQQKKGEEGLAARKKSLKIWVVNDLFLFKL